MHRQVYCESINKVGDRFRILFYDVQDENEEKRTKHLNSYSIFLEPDEAKKIIAGEIYTLTIE